MSIVVIDILAVFRRSKGYCECQQFNHDHQGRCNNPILWRNRGLKTAFGTLLGVWEIRHIVNLKKGGRNNVDNLQILCFECDRKLKSKVIRVRQ